MTQRKISHQQSMEIDLDLDTIGSEMVKILRQLKKQRQSVRPKFIPGRQDNKKK